MSAHFDDDDLALAEPETQAGPLDQADVDPAPQPPALIQIGPLDV